MPSDPFDHLIQFLFEEFLRICVTNDPPLKPEQLAEVRHMFFAGARAVIVAIGTARQNDALPETWAALNESVQKYEAELTESGGVKNWTN